MTAAKPRSFYPRAEGLYRRVSYALNAIHAGPIDRRGDVRALREVLNSHGMTHPNRKAALAATRGIMGTPAGQRCLVCVDVVRRDETYLGSVTSAR